MLQDLRHAVRGLLRSPAFAAAVAFFATWLPARRATAISPIAALRQD